MTDMNIDEKNELTPEEILEREQDNRVEHLLAGLQPGYKLSIYRFRPSWCRSWLETIELGASDSIDMSYLAETWGGDILRLKVLDEKGRIRGQVDVPMMSYPPKVHGKVLKRGSLNEMDPEFLTPQTAIEKTSQVLRPENSLATIVDALSKIRKDDWSVAKSLLPMAMPVQERRPYAELEELARTIETLRGIFSTFNTQTATNQVLDGDTAFISSIADMVKTVFSAQEKKQSKPVTQTMKIVPPSYQKIGSNELVSVLAKMDPKTASEVFINSLQNMKAADAENTMKNIFASIQGSDTLTEGEGEDEDEDEDEDIEKDDL